MLPFWKFVARAPGVLLAALLGLGIACGDVPNTVGDSFVIELAPGALMEAEFDMTDARRSRTPRRDSFTPRRQPGKSTHLRARRLETPSGGGWATGDVRRPGPPWTRFGWSVDNGPAS